MLARLTLIVALTSLGACASKPPAPTGFLSTYDHLEQVNEHRLEYISSDLASYRAFIVEPVAFRLARKQTKLNDNEREDLAQHFKHALEAALLEQHYEVVDQPAPGAARIRFAITDVRRAVWVLNLHPGSKLTGAGAGGAAMEGEIVDSISGRQLAAMMQSSRGSQFELDTFNTLDDAKDVIDRWARDAAARLADLRDE